MTFEQWRDEFLGKGIDFDGKYSFQCMDVYRSYVARVLGFPQSRGLVPPNEGAADIWNTYLPNYFTRVSNSPQAVPGKGDICIWKKAKSNGNYGHVAIVEKADLNTLTILEQDGLTNSVLKRRTTNYTNVLGWLVPNIMPEDTIPVKKTDFENLVAKASKLDDLVKKNITEERVIGLEQVIDSDRKRFDSYRETLAKNLEAENTWDSVIQQSATFSSVKDKADTFEDRLDREQKQHDLERNQLLDEVAQLKADIEKQMKQNETLLARLEVLEKKAEQQDEQKQQLDAFRRFIETITNLFKRNA